MKKRVLIAVLVLSLMPLFGIALLQPAAAQTPPVSCAVTAAALDPGAGGEAMTPVSTCGANFCTQAQKTQCASSCRRHPFVGLECCFDTCTSFCNCGSVPTGC